MWWTNQQNNWDDRVIPADVRPSLPWDQLPVCEVWTKQGLRLDAGSNEHIILVKNIIIHIWCIFFFGKFSSRWSTSLVSTGDFSSSRPLENLSLPESLPRWELLKLTKHITKPHIPEYSLPRRKLFTFKTNIKYSSGIGRTTTTSRTCPAASLALLCGMPRSTSLLSNLDFFFFIQNLCPKRGSIHWPNLYCSDLSLGHSCLWQPHPRHHPHDQDHPRVHREEVQEVQQRSHKVSTISLHRPFLHFKRFHRTVRGDWHTDVNREIWMNLYKFINMNFE